MLKLRRSLSYLFRADDALPSCGRFGLCKIALQEVMALPYILIAAFFCLAAALPSGVSAQAPAGEPAKTGLFDLKEQDIGKNISDSIPTPSLPSEEYLTPIDPEKNTTAQQPSAEAKPTADSGIEALENDLFSDTAAPAPAPAPAGKAAAQEQFKDPIFTDNAMFGDVAPKAAAPAPSPAGATESSTSASAPVTPTSPTSASALDAPIIVPSNAENVPSIESIMAEEANAQAAPNTQPTASADASSGEPVAPVKFSAARQMLQQYLDKFLASYQAKKLAAQESGEGATIPDTAAIAELKTPETTEEKIRAMYPYITKAQLDAFAGDCLNLPDHLKNCSIFRCTLPQENGTAALNIIGKEGLGCTLETTLNNGQLRCSLDEQTQVASTIASAVEQNFENTTPTKFKELLLANTQNCSGTGEYANMPGLTNIASGPDVTPTEVVATDGSTIVVPTEEAPVTSVTATDNTAPTAEKEPVEDPTDIAALLEEPAIKTGADTSKVNNTPATPEVKKEAEKPSQPTAEVAVTPVETTPVKEDDSAKATEEKATAASKDTEKDSSKKDAAKVANADNTENIEQMLLESEPKQPTATIAPADKAYMEMLDKKQESLPKGKQLSDATKNTIKDLAPTLVTPKKTTAKTEPERFKVDHETDVVDGEEIDGVMHSKTGIELSIKDSAKKAMSIDAKEKMDLAYRALLAGQVSASISIYKEILDKDHDNGEALFGLATAYHRNGQFDQARAIYTEVLKREPNNKEVLNNFLVLVAEEAPESAILELQKLERINSDFSPIPAQIAMIYLKNNQPDKAERYLRRAIILSPENVTYKYNLAITSDRLGDYPQAAQLYRQVLEAAKEGAVIPGSVASTQERLKFLEKKLNINQ